MHPATILSYYPKYELLDEIMSHGNGNYTEMNIYGDLKNNLQSLYMKHTIELIIENSRKAQFIDSSVFSSVLSWIAFHKMYAIRRGIKLNIYMFFESGQSYYHKNISKKYKISRRSDDLYGLDKESRDLFFDVLQKNLQLIQKACSKLPDVNVVRLTNLEADFVPFYLMRNKLVDTSDKTVHVTYSNDHDLMQNVYVAENSFQYSKAGKKRRLFKKGEVLKHYLKDPGNEFPDAWYPYLMAINGDVGDDVYGVKGIGEKTLIKIASELVEMVGGIDNLYENVMKGNPIYKPEDASNENKHIQKIVQAELNDKIVSNNLKLVSFELLSRFVDDPPNTETIEKRNMLHECLNQTQIAPIEAMRVAIEKNRVYLEEDTLDTIYYKPQDDSYCG